MNSKGRPKCEAREVAIMLGDKFYDGAPCRNCRNTKRYTAGGACEECTRSRNEFYRDKAKPDRNRQMSVADHAVAAVAALDKFGAALADSDLQIADHDMLEFEDNRSAALEAAAKNKQPWD